MSSQQCTAGTGDATAAGWSEAGSGGRRQDEARQGEAAWQHDSRAARGAPAARLTLLQVPCASAAVGFWHLRFGVGLVQQLAAVVQPSWPSSTQSLHTPLATLDPAGRTHCTPSVQQSLEAEQPSLRVVTTLLLAMQAEQRPRPADTMHLAVSGRARLKLQHWLVSVQP